MNETLLLLKNANASLNIFISRSVYKPQLLIYGTYFFVCLLSRQTLGSSDKYAVKETRESYRSEFSDFRDGDGLSHAQSSISRITYEIFTSLNISSQFSCRDCSHVFIWIVINI